MSNVMSLERFRGIKLISSSSDTILSHPTSLTMVLGVLMIFFGLYSFCLGIAAICTSASASYIGYGIWCGFMFIVVGIFFTATVCSKNSCMITAMLVLGLVAFFLAVVQLSLASLATDVDSGRKELRLKWGIGGYVYDIFNSKNVFDGNICTGADYFNFSNAWAPINILLIICAIVEMICSFIGVVLAIRALMCGVRRFKDYNLAVQRGYLNSAYDINPPPIYKITE